MHAWAEVCHLLQSSKSPLTGFLCSIGWRITGFLQILHSISNSAILRNNYISLLSDLCACVHMKKMASKGSHSSSVSDSNRLIMWLQTWKKAMGWCTTQWKMLLFCAKTIAKESRKFELACLKKKEKHFGRLATFWFGVFAMLFSAIGCVFCHENTRKWTIVCYNRL